MTEFNLAAVGRNVTDADGLPPVRTSADRLWDNLARFLDDVLPMPCWSANAARDSNCRADAASAAGAGQAACIRPRRYPAANSRPSIS